jgi:hypothetical protein
MINQTAYDTTALHGFVTTSITDPIKKIVLVDSMVGAPDKKLDNVYVVRDSDSSFTVPGFAHPIVMGRPEMEKLSPMFSGNHYGQEAHNDRFLVMTDIRAFGKFDPIKRQFTIRNQIEHGQAMVRAGLTEVWANEGPSLLQNISSLPLTCYASWLSENIARNFKLTPIDQMKCAVYAGIFYCSLFSNDKTFDEKTKGHIASTVSRATRTEAKVALEMLDRLETVPETITDWCARAEDVVGSVNLKLLSPRLLFNIIGGTWFGVHGREMVQVALEHPPTWMSILLTAFHERSFTKTNIAQLVERGSNKEQAKSYVRAVLNLIQYELD